MIQRYSDHAANERTFLAWVRTAIAIMAFGFLVERFDLFLQIAGQTLARRALSPTGQLIGNTAGLILIGLGAGLTAKEVLQQHGVVVVAGEDDRFAQAACRSATLMPFSIRFRRITPVGVLVEDVLIDCCRSYSILRGLRLVSSSCCRCSPSSRCT